MSRRAHVVLDDIRHHYNTWFAAVTLALAHTGDESAKYQGTAELARSKVTELMREVEILSKSIDL